MTVHVVGRLVFILFQLLALALSTGDGLAQTGSLKHSPADVVKRYLTLDHKGARLDAMSSETVVSYTSWSEEPAWGHVVVTRGFVVAEHYRQWEVIDSLEVVIPVTFHVLGSVYMETAGFVQGAMLPPHVGQKRMVNVVREAWLKETDPAKRDRLGSLQGELREAK
jgi:hypothetical protein